MATCNLCPPGRRDVPDEEMARHLREVHPQVAEDGTRRSDGSTITRDVSSAPVPDAPEGEGEWRS